LNESDERLSIPNNILDSMEELYAKVKELNKT
jgi:hypothetical protein